MELNYKLPKMTSVKSLHFVGIGGCGMSAIAKILFLMGYEISGSDIKESTNTLRLKELGATVFYGHSAANVRRADLVVVSSAIPPDNPEILEAKAREIPVVPRASMLGWLFTQNKIPIGVAGTHGKTTTTSMIATILEKNNLEPTYLIGGEMNDLNGNAFLGKNNYLVAEMDESDGSLVYLKPRYFVLTNVEADHLEYFGSLTNIVNFFLKFINKLPSDGVIFANYDHPQNKKIIKNVKDKIRVITYGFEEGTDLKAVNPRFSGLNSWFECIWKGKNLGEIELIVPGFHNIYNALGAIAVALELGLDINDVRLALRSFAGSRRRFQLIGEIEGISIFDDYAHHPTEVAVTLKSAHESWPGRRIIAIFQPHRFTRTMFLYRDFGDVFKQADVVIITEIYSAGESPIKGISGSIIAEQVKKNSSKKVIYLPRKEKIVDYVLNIIEPGDLILIMGAGDIYTIAKEIFYRLSSHKKEVKTNI